MVKQLDILPYRLPNITIIKKKFHGRTLFRPGKFKNSRRRAITPRAHDTSDADINQLRIQMLGEAKTLLILPLIEYASKCVSAIKPALSDTFRMRFSLMAVNPGKRRVHVYYKWYSPITGAFKASVIIDPGSTEWFFLHGYHAAVDLGVMIIYKKKKKRN